ncbi:MAG: ABC transporter ATP-binding protein [Prosthecochloris sp.]|nr:ABC transporter ATP-binding protein [Prosthecochloris sp.]
MQSLLECHNVAHAYGRNYALEDVSFTIAPGKITGLLGKNGAGKSTVINILMGFLKPMKGECRIFGEPSHALTPGTRARIGLLQEGFIQYDFMSPRELERYFAPFYPQWNRDSFFELIRRTRIPETKKLTQLSCGQRSQVVLGLILAQQPELMILDDYSMGIDAGYRRLFIDFLREYIADYKTTVLLTSHIVQELDQAIDEVIILKEGHVVTNMSKPAFLQSFRCYQFKRSTGSEQLTPYGPVRSVEQTKHATRLYSFSDETTVKAYLAGHDIEHEEFSSVPLSIEDAFIGLTGKY